MRILGVWVWFFCCLLLASEPKSSPLELISQLESNEALLRTLKQSDGNVSVGETHAQTIDRYALQKEKILQKIIERVRKGELTLVAHDELGAQLRELGYKVDANRRLGNSTAVQRDEALLLSMTLRGDLVRLLQTLQMQIRQGATPEQLKTLLSKEIERLHGLNVSPFEETLKKSNASSAIIHELRQNVETLTTLKGVGLELLFSLEGALPTLSSDSTFLRDVRIRTLIDALDAQTALRIGPLGLGKIVLISAVLLFFFSIRRLLARLLARLVERTWLKREDSRVHLYFVRGIQQPINAFLILYSLSLSLQIYHYPQAIPEHVGQWLEILYVIIGAWGVIKLISVYGEYLIGTLVSSSDNLRKEVINMGMKLAYFGVFLVALFLIFQFLEYNVSAILASLGIGGLAVALAAKETLANFFSSVMILLDNSFSQGDWIECDGMEGTVVEIGIRQTTIRTFDNALLYIPNSKLADGAIKNWNRRRIGRRIKLKISLMYDSPPEKLRNCIEEIRAMLENHPEIANAQEVMESANERDRYREKIVSLDDLYGYKRTLCVYLDELGESSIDVLIICFTRTIDWDAWMRIKQEVLFKIIEIVYAHKLSFAFPSQSVYVEHKGDESLLPPKGSIYDL